jgi:isopenicillin N synthase-like dioxygenase
MTTVAELVIIDYTDLLGSSNALLESIEQAFGPSGTGIIGIRNVPDFVQAKQDLLPLAYPLAHLPAEELQLLEDPDSLFNAGWSHGKEKLKADTPDLAKGSFYFNPLVDVPGTAQDRKTYPCSYPCNKWPSTTASTGSLSQLEPAAKRMGTMMKNVAVDLSKHIDAYAHSKLKEQYAPDTLYSALVDTQKAKGRLLYYFPLSEQVNTATTNGSTSTDALATATSTSSNEDSWIGWHNDSGFLTALAGDLYFDPATGQILPVPPPGAGLYVVDRTNEVRQVLLPPDCMAIQMGECTQILTGGLVVATPHCVRGASGVARASLACFIDTPPTFQLALPVGCTREAVLQFSQTRVPPLNDRWTETNMAFGDFLQQTFEKYYDWTPAVEEAK